MHRVCVAWAKNLVSHDVSHNSFGMTDQTKTLSAQ